MVSSEFEIRRPVPGRGTRRDVYLQRTVTILRNESINPMVAMEFAPEKGGVLCGINEARGASAKDTARERQRDMGPVGRRGRKLQRGCAAGQGALWLHRTLRDGDLRDVGLVLRLGRLRRASAWTLRATRLYWLSALGTSTRTSPPRWTTPAYRGGCVSCSTIQGARMANVTPAGNMPHSLNLIIGEAVRAIEAFDRAYAPRGPPGRPRRYPRRRGRERHQRRPEPARPPQGHQAGHPCREGGRIPPTSSRRSGRALTWLGSATSRSW